MREEEAAWGVSPLFAFPLVVPAIAAHYLSPLRALLSRPPRAFVFACISSLLSRGPTNNVDSTAIIALFPIRKFEIVIR